MRTDAVDRLPALAVAEQHPVLLVTKLTASMAQPAGEPKWMQRGLVDLHQELAIQPPSGHSVVPAHVDARAHPEEPRVGEP